jgi:hypothetical protein
MIQHGPRFTGAVIDNERLRGMKRMAINPALSRDQDADQQ